VKFCRLYQNELYYHNFANLFGYERKSKNSKHPNIIIPDHDLAITDDEIIKSTPTNFPITTATK
jgi:hypothetical protein